MTRYVSGSEEVRGYAGGGDPGQFLPPRGGSALTSAPPATDDSVADLRSRIGQALNATSAENGSDTPDYILAEYLTDSLAAFDRAVRSRDLHRGADPYFGDIDAFAMTWKADLAFVVGIALVGFVLGALLV